MKKMMEFEEELMVRMKIQAAKERRPVSKLILQAVEDYLKKVDISKPPSRGTLEDFLDE